MSRIPVCRWLQALGSYSDFVRQQYAALQVAHPRSTQQRLFARISRSWRKVTERKVRDAAAAHIQRAWRASALYAAYRKRVRRSYETLVLAMFSAKAHVQQDEQHMPKLTPDVLLYIRQLCSLSDS